MQQGGKPRCILVLYNRILRHSVVSRQELAAEPTLFYLIGNYATAL